ncbi:MAG: glycosyltransferase family 4 protein [Chloroflexi bacterium]|nr:MAG: glycosyltransferase family 4 protein [Chloroflexota bacterium]
MTAGGRLRVAQVITRFIAGAGGVAYRGALAIDPQRYAVTILSAAGGGLLVQAERAGFEVVRLEHMRPELNPLQDWQGLRELTRLLADRRFDLVHTHSSKAGALGRLAAWQAGVPAIVHTFHGFPFHAFQSWPRRAAYINAERRLGRITDAFLAVGASVAAEAIRLGIAPPDRVRAISSAIDAHTIPVSAESRQAARRLLRVPPDCLLVGTVGRLDSQKSPEDLVAAIASLRPDVRAVWIGDGPLRARVQEMVDRLGLANRFQLLGERDDVAWLLPGLDVFAMASLYEGLPCALVEAMVTGIPVVATTVNAVPEVVVPGKTGLLVPPRAPAALARAIGYLLDHPARAHAMALAARQHVGDRFNAQELGRDLADTYEQALAMARPRSAWALPAVARVPAAGLGAIRGGE